MLFGFAPWIVYWVLVGNVPFETAVLVALGIAVAGLVVGVGGSINLSSTTVPGDYTGS